MLDYDKLAAFAHPRMVKSVRRYIEHGGFTGAFLTALICNDLRGSFTYADSENTAHMRDWVRWFHTEMPGSCWGSHKVMESWRAERREAAA